MAETPHAQRLIQNFLGTTSSRSMFSREEVQDLLLDVLRALDPPQAVEPADGVYPPICGDCSDSVVPGTLYPWAPGGDISLPYVERCDDCTLFDSDHDAAVAVAEKLGCNVKEGPWGAYIVDRHGRPRWPHPSEG